MSSGYALLSKLYDDIPTMRHDSRRTQACQGDLPGYEVFLKKMAGSSKLDVMDRVLKKLRLGHLTEVFQREKSLQI